MFHHLHRTTLDNHSVVLSTSVLRCVVLCIRAPFFFLLGAPRCCHSALRQVCAVPHKGHGQKHVLCECSKSFKAAQRHKRNLSCNPWWKAERCVPSVGRATWGNIWPSRLYSQSEYLRHWRYVIPPAGAKEHQNYSSVQSCSSGGSRSYLSH